MNPLLLDLTRAILPLVQGMGMRPSALPGVEVWYCPKHFPRAPISYDPMIVIIAQGRKIGYFSGERINYGAGKYLVMSVQLPFECETIGSAKEPLVGLSIALTPPIVTGLMMRLNPPPRAAATPSIMRAAKVTNEVLEPAIRLARALASEEEAAVLGPGIVQEILYRVMRGPLGSNLLALGAVSSQFGAIQHSLRFIAKNYAKPLTVAQLAATAGMSISTYHQHFKAVMRSSPLQYLKRVRLHRAQELMIHQGLTAGAAAFEVGYQSASQFSREFRRHFGGSPAAVAREQRGIILGETSDV
jgi:AraC-like DNA-binding protein